MFLGHAQSTPPRLATPASHAGGDGGLPGSHRLASEQGGRESSGGENPVGVYWFTGKRAVPVGHLSTVTFAVL